MRILIKNATLIDPTHPSHGQTLSFLIEEGILKKINPATVTKADRVLEASNLHVSRGWFDPLVSFGEPGFEERETLANGLHAAAHSGFTHIGLLPNTAPVIDSQNGIIHQLALSKEKLTRVHPLGALTVGSQGKKLTELYTLQQAGAMAFYDAFLPVSNPQQLKIALEYCQSFKGLLLSHPITEALQQGGMMHEGETSTYLGLKGIPSISESIQIHRDLEILENSGGQLHIPFVSTAAAVAHIRAAKKKGLSVSCSVGLPHLFFDDTALRSYNTNLKLEPPIRSKTDQRALREGLLDGTIDCISSMHQPMNPEIKELEFELAANGTIGLEACFGILCTLFPVEQVVEFLTRGKSIFSIPNASIEEGQTADLTFFDPTSVSTLEKTNLLSTSQNCAYLGASLSGKVLGTYNNKQLLWNADLAT